MATKFETKLTITWFVYLPVCTSLGQ